MRSRTLLLVRAALLALGVVMPAPALELLFRTAGPVVPGEYSLGVEREFDPLLGWRLRPNFVGGKRTAEFAVRFATNARGLREGNPPYEKPPGGTRVLVLGDSFVEAAHVSAGEAMTTRLQDLLRGGLSPRPADVVNAGVAAYGTAQEYLYVDTEGYKYRPDVVVLVFFTGNDPLDNVRRRYGAYDRPYFEANEGGGLQQVGFPTRDPADDAPVDEALTRHSTAYNFLKSGVWAKLADRSKETGEAGVDPDRDYEVYEMDPRRKMRQSWAVTELLLKELAERCDELGASLVVVAAPSYRQVVPENFERLLRREHLDVGDFGFDVPNRKLNELAARRGITYLDLLPALRAASAGDPFRFYYPKNAHWNPAGHRFVAEQLHAFLIRRGLVPPEHAGDRGS
jgi:lysophospholipase L1-like esterase